MSGTRLRGAVIGCGNISEFHLRGWARIPEVEIVALADPDRARAMQRRDAFAPAASVYESLEAALGAGQLDFVDILTLPWDHSEHCLRAKAAGVHIICQKPLCDDLGDARRLVGDFTGYRKLFSVHENHVYRPWFRHVLAEHRRQAFGALRWVRLEQNDPALPPQEFCRTSELGVLLVYGVHLIDMVRALLGTPERVSARLHRVSAGVRGESLAHAAFEYPDATAIVDIAWKDGGFGQGGALVLGDRGEAFYEGTMIRGGAARLRVARDHATVLDQARSSMDDYVEAFYLFERAFTDAMTGVGPAPQPAAQNLSTLEMTFAAYASAQRGRAVVFDEFHSAPRK
ncbi:MAG TPA: Gfo/Idh/MocA family oxidoreductase [Candidatus Sulfotelmatobacter sp.]|nr:Gfo/Idh/MocA family oxidoreductase [Candidatus Sulfotelmatobacter sp.]